jgi:hypothetical protein
MAIDRVKSDRFKRVASKRVENLIKGIRSLSKCSNRGNYHYESEEIRKMLKAIKDEMKIMETLYKNNLSSKNDTFNF